MAMGSSQSLVARLNPPGDPEESLSLGPASNKQQREIGSLAMLRFALSYTTISHRFCRGEIDVPHHEPRWPMEKWTIDVACRAEHFGPGAKGLPKGLTTRDRRLELVEGKLPYSVSRTTYIEACRNETFTISGCREFRAHHDIVFDQEYSGMVSRFLSLLGDHSLSVCAPSVKAAFSYTLSTTSTRGSLEAIG